MTDQELIDYYVNLLIIQYRTRPKAQAHMDAIMGQEIIYEIAKAVEVAYNIDSTLGPTAVGDQLDIIAKYVSAQRTVTGIDFTRTFFGSVDYVTALPYTGVAGSIDYDEANPPDAQILAYETDQESQYSLTDSELLTIIRLKIAQNNSNHSLAEIDTIIDDFFSGQVLLDDLFNMTISYIFDEDVRRIIEIAVSQGAIPKPAGVGLLVSFVPDINNIFGSLDYGATEVPDFLSGSNVYSADPFGSSLTY